MIPKIFKGQFVQRLVLALYQLAGIVLLPLIIIALLVRSRKQPEYRARLLERLGFCSKAKHKGHNSDEFVAKVSAKEKVFEKAWKENQS